MEVKIEVIRRRISVTQGFADVVINGQVLFSCRDTIKLLEPGEKYFGPYIAGYASTTPDIQFIEGMLYHRYDNVYHYSDRVKTRFSELKAAEIASADEMYRETLEELAKANRWPKEIIVKGQVGTLYNVHPLGNNKFRPIYMFGSGTKFVEEEELIPYYGSTTHHLV